MTTDFKGIINDRNFKVFFKSKDTLKDFLNSYLEFLDIKHAIIHVEHVLQALIMPDNIDYKDFYADVLATLANGEIILVEMFSSFTINEFKKSTNYVARVYSNQVEYKEKDYTKAKKCTCINLMKGNFKRINPKLINRYAQKNIDSNEMINEGEIEMVLVRLDLVENLEYINSNKRFIRWLKIINAKSFEEMKKIAEGDKIMQDSIEYLKWYHENLDHGFQDIIDEEIYDARKEERKDTKFDIAKNLISLNISIKDIMKATGLSEKQVNKLIDKEG